MDNNEVYALFDDIKGNLKSINSKLENTPKVNNNPTVEQALVMDLPPIKGMFDNSVQRHQEQTRSMQTKFAEAEVKASNRILKLMWTSKETFTQSLDEPQEHIHRHSFDIRSSKVFSFLVSMSVICGLSI